jgi:hypothetical protein
VRRAGSSNARGGAEPRIRHLTEDCPNGRRVGGAERVRERNGVPATLFPAVDGENHDTRRQRPSRARAFRSRAAARSKRGLLLPGAALARTGEIAPAGGETASSAACVRLLCSADVARAAGQNLEKQPNRSEFAFPHSLRGARIGFRRPAEGASAGLSVCRTPRLRPAGKTAAPITMREWPVFTRSH